MNNITGTILEAGYHLDAAGTIPGVTIAANSDEELQGWDGPMYGRRVVIVDETDYDARETELAKAVGELQVLRENVQRLKEELESANSRPPTNPHLAAIAYALHQAKRKHPFFAYVAVSTHNALKAERDLSYCREYLKARIDDGRCSGMTVLSCEIAEASDAFARRDYAHTLEELAQCGAVIVRMMEAVHELAYEVAKAGKEAK